MFRGFRSGSVPGAGAVKACWLLIAISAAASWSAQAEDYAQNAKVMPPAPLHEQVLHLSGDPDRPVDLVVTLYTPEGDGPFPLAVVNHGVNGSKERPADMARNRYTYAAYYFVSRGYAVALPMMRGYGGSGGNVGHYGCDLGALALDNGRDIEGVISGLGSNPQIDTTRVVVAGQSFGGWNTLGFGALTPPNVRGLIDCFGGVRTSACPQGPGGNDASLVQAAARFGAATTLPSLWFYGENDSLFQPEVWQPMHDAYAQAGGQVELVDVGRFMDDSHQMLSHPESIPIWVPRVDAFLARIGLPSRAVFPDYMPLPVPPPTHFAPVEDVAAVPWIGDDGRRQYEHFLTLGLPRVFMVAPGGQSASANGGFDPLGRGYTLCRNAHLSCMPYAVDSDVVWVKQAALQRPAATHFAAIDDVSAVPWVNDKGRASYAHFLTLPPPRAFVIGTGGENISVHGKADPLSQAMTICQSAHLVCYPYVVDNDVVWVKPPPPPRGPRPSGFAPLGNVEAVPWVNAQGRSAYAHFLTVPLPRAFAVATGGQSVLTQGGYDPVSRALSLCQSHGLACRMYAVDNSVVWVPPGR